ncbi:Xaa-Pro peptidase family protein [Mesorhizobium sp. M2A.F.Ca.ET.039.01.1.1]|uniref:M24 family metallopeptidase n=1 Tax=Mesorhizobium sp. M2A.F.Ca.ET.039.01.1.1 TaxID=2496746 RepID=UPI0016719B5C|nr:Xaa-Pro peptidase family protein [Mesorhizobium sp. M2A.F.Ca.ET.039.01.1.1]
MNENSENAMTANPANSRLTFPSDADYRNRIAHAQASMKQAGIDVLALSGFDYLRFFTGLNGLPVGRPIWLVLLQEGAPAFVSPRSEAKEIRARCATPVAAQWVEWEEPVPAPMTHQDALAKYIGEVAAHARTIGVDFNSTWALNVDLVRQALGAERVKDVTGLLRGLLAIKDAVAIDVIRRSTDIVAHQVIACQEIIAPGIPEWKVALASFNAATERSAQWWSGDEEQSPFVQGMQMMGSGHQRTARCHCAGGGRIMQDGEILQICFCGPSFFGHAIGYDRPFRIGSKPMPADLRKLVDVAREAQEAALAKIRPGVTAGEVHAAAVAVIESGGWDNPFLHRTGRGIGYSDFDGLELKAGSTTVLEPGMVMTVEPAPYVDGIGGARFGDTVLVTETGHEVLTPFNLGRDI